MPSLMKVKGLRGFTVTGDEGSELNELRLIRKAFEKTATFLGLIGILIGLGVLAYVVDKL